MLDFAILAFPRSGTTWATAWLSHYATVLHDPIVTRSHDEIEAWADATSGYTGISCTASMLWPEWVKNTYERGTRILVLRRPVHEINKSLEAIDLPTIAPNMEHQIDQLPGLHLDYNMLFDSDAAQQILEYCLPDATFSPVHHAEMCDMHIVIADHVIERLKEIARRSGVH